MTDLGIVPIAVAICASLAVGAWRVNSLNKGGAISAALLGGAIFVVPVDGWKWFIVLAVFLSISSCMTRYRYQAKRKKGFAQEKGGARGWRNVTANGLAAAMLALLSPFYPRELMLAAFLGAVATANADTLATEIGLLYRGDPRLITNLRRVVPAGTSGGISVLGELAALLGALAIGIMAVLLKMTDSNWLPTALIATSAITGGLVGCFVDSMIGATIQGIYRCVVCNKITENNRHCGAPAILLKGSRLVDNNVVNLAATILGAAFAVAIPTLA